MSYTFARQGWKKNDRFDLEGMCRVGQELKIDGVDMVTTYGIAPEVIRRTLADHGLKIVCYTFFPKLNKPTAAERAAVVDDVKKGFDIAVSLCADKVMIHTSGDPKLPRDICRSNWIHGLQECAGLARAAGITMTIENIPGATSPLIISSDILEAIREVPGLKLTYDNGNVMQGEDPVISFHRCAEHVVHAHFKDLVLAEPGLGMEGLDGRRYQSALIGEGIVPQRECLAAMKQAGYKGYINIEYEGNKYPPDEATRRATDYLLGLMEEINR